MYIYIYIYIALTANSLQIIMEKYAKEVELLKEEVRAMLLDGDTAPAEKMCLINSLHRLGVSYHFEKEIEDQLDHIFQLRSSIDYDEYDLYTISLQFRVFRQHGYNMSCGESLHFSLNLLTYEIK